MNLREFKSLVHEMRLAQKAYFCAHLLHKQKLLVKAKLLEKKVDDIINPGLFPND